MTEINIEAASTTLRPGQEEELSRVDAAGS